MRQQQIEILDWRDCARGSVAQVELSHAFVGLKFPYGSTALSRPLLNRGR